MPDYYDIDPESPLARLSSELSRLGKPPEISKLSRLPQELISRMNKVYIALMAEWKDKALSYPIPEILKEFNTAKLQLDNGHWE